MVARSPADLHKKVAIPGMRDGCNQVPSVINSTSMWTRIAPSKYSGQMFQAPARLMMSDSSALTSQQALNSTVAATARNPIIPMPSWSVYVGCTRLVISIAVLVFSSICIHVWAAHPSFILTLITSVSTLLIFTYYTLSLTYSTKLYHGIAIFLLELAGTICWTASSVLLAIWVNRHLSADWLYDVTIDNGKQRYLQELPKELTPAKVAAEHFRQFTTAKYLAVLKLAGVSTALSILQLILFAVTMMVYTKNLRNHISEGHSLGEGVGSKKPIKLLAAQQGSDSPLSLAVKQDNIDATTIGHVQK